MNKKNILNLLTLVFFTLTFLLILEIVFHIGYSKYTLDSFAKINKNPEKKLSRFEKIITDPNNFSTRVNSIGIRNEEILKEKEKIRIIIIGDSFTFGLGVDNTNETYPKLLDNLLGQNIEVINFGYPGFNFLDVYWTIKYDIINYDPDLILYAFYENDIEFYRWNIEYPYCKVIDEKNPGLFTFFESNTNFFMTKLMILGRVYDTKIYPKLPAWNCFDTTLELINELSQEENFNFIIFIIPHYSGQDSAADVTYSKVYHLAEKNDLLTISSFVETFWDKSSNYSNEDLRGDEDNHYNEIAHRIIAESLQEFIIKSNLIENITKND